MTGNLVYDIPIINIGSIPSRDRYPVDRLEIMPGAARPLKFRIINDDGYRINMVDMIPLFVVWESGVARPDGEISSVSSVVFRKMLGVDDPHHGEISGFLSGDDTKTIYENTVGRLSYWSVFLQNAQKELFPLKSSSGDNWFGNIVYPNVRSFPDMEMIRF